LKIDEIDPFMNMFRHWEDLVHSAILPIQFSVSVYVTRMKQGQHELNRLPSFSLFFGERPDVSVEMDKIKITHAPHHRVWAHVCGSTPFTRTVINEAVEHDFDIHHETFEF
jgi:PIN domain nuclease of toxin-antitoxin system